MKKQIIIIALMGLLIIINFSGCIEEEIQVNTNLCISESLVISRVFYDGWRSLEHNLSIYGNGTVRYYEAFVRLISISYEVVEENVEYKLKKRESFPMKNYLN